MDLSFVGVARYHAVVGVVQHDGSKIKFFIAHTNNSGTGVKKLLELADMISFIRINIMIIFFYDKVLNT